MTSKLSLVLAIAAVALGAAGPARAADAARTYPDRPIRFIVPNTAGASVDVTGRIYAAALAEALGQQLVVDNRGGAGGAIGMKIGPE